MKRLLMVSILFSMILGTSVIAAQEYTNNDGQQSQFSKTNWTLTPEEWNARAEANQASWMRTKKAFEMNYIDSTKKSWDEYTDAYQKQKKVN